MFGNLDLYAFQYIKYLDFYINTYPEINKISIDVLLGQDLTEIQVFINIESEGSKNKTI